MKKQANRKRAAAYCRVSTGMECQEGSLAWQIRYYKEILSCNPATNLIRIYADEGSGRSIRDRPEFCQMIQDCEAGKIDVIYTKSISRFSRNLIDCLTVLHRLKMLGIPVFFEKEHIDSMELQSEFLFHVLSIVAQEESRSIGQNILWGIQQRHAQGIPTGKVTYGYRRIDKFGHWMIEESEARRVRYAFDQAARGICFAEIRAGLDEMESRDRTGVSWSQNRNRLPLLLRNVNYTGDYITDTYFAAFGKRGCRYSKKNCGEHEQFYLEDHHVPIISREQFHRVQVLLHLGLLHSRRKYLTEEQRTILQDPDWR